MMRRDQLSTTALLGIAAVLVGVSAVNAEDTPRSRQNLEEPVLRVAKRDDVAGDAHPLDPALEIASSGLKTIREKITDYTATLVKRERVNGKLGDYEYMFAKIRNRKTVNGKIATPFSVYLYFLKPSSMKGREVLYVEGQNNGKMIAHEGGTAGKYLPTIWLRPDGIIAMRGQRYPLTDVGVENLVLKLIERGERERKLGNDNCEVTFHRNAKINGRVCTLLQVRHPEPSPKLDFHVAQIFIDDELNVPIRYAAYDWPAQAGEEPPVLEEYTYLNLKVNVGLKDADFDHNNKDYGFH